MDATFQIDRKSETGELLVRKRRGGETLNERLRSALAVGGARQRGCEWGQSPAVHNSWRVIQTQERGSGSRPWVWLIDKSFVRTLSTN